MAKTSRKKPSRNKAAAKATKRAKTATRRKAAKKKTAKRKSAKTKRTAAKKPRKLAARKTTKPAAKKTVAAKTKPAAGTINAPPESLPHKVAGVFSAVVDIFTDAERLHHKLEPDISNEPE